MTLDKVEAMDASGVVLSTLEGDALAAMTLSWGLVDGALPPGGSGFMLLDVGLTVDAALPATIATRITTTRRIGGSDGKPAPLPDTAPVPATIAFTAAEVEVGPAAVVIEAPLRGEGWVAINGCCDAPTSHRIGLQTINAAVEFPERFAIDWMQLDASGQVFTGDGSKVEDYVFYGAPVYAVADAEVVNAFDEPDPQTPMARDPNLKPEVIAGNFIVLDLGEGRYALYAHLLKGSQKVKVGDTVKAGDVIA